MGKKVLGRGLDAIIPSDLKERRDRKEITTVKGKIENRDIFLQKKKLDDEWEKIDAIRRDMEDELERRIEDQRNINQQKSDIENEMKKIENEWKSIRQNQNKLEKELRKKEFDNMEIAKQREKIGEDLKKIDKEWEKIEIVRRGMEKELDKRRENQKRINNELKEIEKIDVMLNEERNTIKRNDELQGQMGRIEEGINKIEETNNKINNTKETLEKIIAKSKIDEMTQRFKIKELELERERDAISSKEEKFKAFINDERQELDRMMEEFKLMAKEDEERIKLRELELDMEKEDIKRECDSIKAMLRSIKE